MSNSHIFDNNILRAYDIRGEVGKNLNNIDAERLGNIFASSFCQKWNQESLSSHSKLSQIAKKILNCY